METTGIIKGLYRDYRVYIGVIFRDMDPSGVDSSRDL